MVLSTTSWVVIFSALTLAEVHALIDYSEIRHRSSGFRFVDVRYAPGMGIDRPNLLR